MPFEILDTISLPGNPLKPNDDAFGHLDGAAVVLDGATSLGDPLMPGDSDAAWVATLATTKEDDGSYTEVDGIGDRAAQGAIKEFDVQAGGYILVVHGADVNTSDASSFTRSMEKTLAQSFERTTVW